MFTVGALRVNRAARIAVHRIASISFDVPTTVEAARARGSCDLYGLYRGSWTRPHTNEPQPRARARVFCTQLCTDCGCTKYAVCVAKLPGQSRDCNILKNRYHSDKFIVAMFRSLSQEKFYILFSPCWIQLSRNRQSSNFIPFQVIYRMFLITYTWTFIKLVPLYMDIILLGSFR